jgi:prenyltransferase beta subunit
MYIGLFYITIVLVLTGLSLLKRKDNGSNTLEKEVAETVGIYTGTLDGKLRFPDESFKRKVLYWLTPGVDTTYFAVIALKKLEKLYADSKASDFETFRLKNANNIEEFVRRHFDVKTRGMKHNLEALPTVYGMYCGLVLLKELRSIPALGQRLTHKTAETLLGPNIVSGMIRYLEGCESSDGGYSVGPDTNDPTVMNTDMALSILWNLEQKPKNLDKTREFIWSCKRWYDSTFGFVNTPNEEVPCACLTSYAMRALLYLEAIRRDAPTFEGVRDDLQQQAISREDLQTVTKFMELCIKAAQGGFPKHPDEPPTLFHTDIILNFVKGLSKQLKIDDIKKKINVLDTLQWTRLRENESGGFGFEPSYLSNVYSTKGGIVILSNLKDLFKDMQETVVSDGLSAHTKHRQFLYSCFDERMGGFAGYTIAVPRG